MSNSQFTISPQFKALRWRLLLSSLGVIGFTLATFGLVIYQVVARSLEQKSNRQLEILADAAAHSLSEIIATPELIGDRTPRTLDDDGDLDLPWQDLQQAQQSVEWFDAKGQLVGRTGRYFPATPLLVEAEPSQDAVYQEIYLSSLTEEHEEHEDENDESEEAHERESDHEIEIHVLTLPVYSSQPDSSTAQLQGYVRVSESDEAVEEELERLRLGLQWGSVLALIFSGVGGWWLTRQSLQPIDRSIRQLKQFTADASHELRNPLTAIKASVDVMQSHEERWEVSDRAKLAAIASATNLMSQLVDDLLWLARSDRISFPDRKTSNHLVIPIIDLLEEVLDQYLSQAEQKQITFKITDLVNVSVWGDPSQLRRLLGNLVSNALHYTPSGGTVTLSAFTQDDEVSIQVTDNGIGIAAEHLPFVFDRFWRADQARTRREGGSGLGLAIAQAIAHQHKGHITVTSQLNKGSCFQVTLPVA